MTSTKYIGMDVHKESISIAVLNFAGKALPDIEDRADFTCTVSVYQALSGGQDCP